MTTNRWAIAAAVGLLMCCSGMVHAEKLGSENYNKGMDYFNKGNFKAAANEFTVAFNLDSSEPYYQAWLGHVLVEKLGDYDKAIQLLGKAPNLEENADALYWLGKAYAKRDNPGKAIIYLEKSYKLKPDPKTKTLLAEMRLAKAVTQKKGGPTGSLIPIFAITVLSVGAVVALKIFVFQQPSVPRDIILFLVLVMVMVFSAAYLGIITGAQFKSIIDKMLSALQRN